MYNKPFCGCCNQLPPAPATCQHVANTVNTCNVQEYPHIVNYHTHHQNSLIKKHVTIPQYSYSEGVQVFDEFQPGPMGMPYPQPYAQPYAPQPYGQPFGQGYPQPYPMMSEKACHAPYPQQSFEHPTHKSHGFECMCKKQQY